MVIKQICCAILFCFIVIGNESVSMLSSLFVFCELVILFRKVSWHVPGGQAKIVWLWHKVYNTWAYWNMVTAFISWQSRASKWYAKYLFMSCMIGTTYQPKHQKRNKCACLCNRNAWEICVNKAIVTYSVVYFTV